ncbi:MAG TPA: family 43 glycosylhydrolase [Rariglobus sp.]|nr:family 43 glycosylhydrolase [Rariglobus sp.]
MFKTTRSGLEKSITTGRLLLAACGAALAAAPACLGANPFITSIYTADPSARVWSDGRLYVYPSHDMDPARGCDLMDRYHVYSTADMVHWRDEGQILQASDVPWGRPEGGFMWAPDCVYRNGTYYFYFPHPSDSKWNNSWKVGVATSKKPTSDFKVGGYIEGLGGEDMIDPCVFIDTDGQAYMYYGGGRKCRGGKLKDNMTELDGPMQPMEGLEDFHEATWVFKRNGIYYLTYADNHPKVNQLRYATSNSPLGPWTSKGVYLTPTDCDTSHGSVVEYKGHWYAFYHNKSISNTGHGNLRSICVDEMHFNPDGTIQVVVQTKEGPASVGPAPAPNPRAVKYAANTAHLEGAATFGGNAVQNLHLAGAACEFVHVDGGKGGRAVLDISHAGIALGKLRLTVNGKDWSFLNTLPTGGWDDYSGHTTFTVPLTPGKTNTIKLTGGNGGVNIDSVTVSPLD